MEVGAACPASVGDGLGACSVGDMPRAGDVIRVNVGLEHVAKLKPELFDELQIPLDLGVDRVDEGGVAGRGIGNEVAIGPGVGVE